MQNIKTSPPDHRTQTVNLPKSGAQAEAQPNYRAQPVAPPDCRLQLEAPSNSEALLAVPPEHRVQPVALYSLGAQPETPLEQGQL